jgi:hypothetical protein
MFGLISEVVRVVPLGTPVFCLSLPLFGLLRQSHESYHDEASDALLRL